MKTFTCCGFTGHNEHTGIALVRAPSLALAVEILNGELRMAGLPGDARPEDMRPWLQATEFVRILDDGI